MRRAATVAILACFATGCGASLMKLPEGTSTAADPPVAAAALADATRGCLAVRTLTAELAVSGSAGGRRLSGRLLGGIAAPASVRLEGVAPFGQPLFIFTAVGDDATLLLPRDDRVLEGGRPDLVLEALAGVPLDAADLRIMLTGCAIPGKGPPSDARAFGETWIVTPGLDGDEVFLRRNGRDEPWELVATTRRAGGAGRRWRAEYTDREAAVPRAIRLTSLDDGGTTGRAFDLRLALSQVEINTPLEPEVFTVRVPAGATPISLNELRAAGPLAPQ
jgi:hypothetical protein